MPKDEDDRQLKPFADWLALQRKGSLANELAEALTTVNRAVVETGKAGSVTLTIKIKAAGDEVSVIVTDEVKSKVPEFDRGQSVFFVDEDGNPHRSQQVLDEATVDHPRLTSVGGVVADAKTGEVL